MRATEHLKSMNQDNWDYIVQHPFCRELASGELPLSKMRTYLVQDYKFVDGFVRLLASAIAHAPGLPDSVPAAQFIAVITGPENTYFLDSFHELDVDETAQQTAVKTPTKAFQKLMHQATTSGRYEEMLAVLVVAEWTYLSWAAPYHPANEKLSPYFADWITLHAGDYFTSVVDYLRDQLDKTWLTLSNAQKSRVETLFTQAVNLEVAFFDMAYEG
jgi:thiaminase (transcriptional activator TenA)